MRLVASALTISLTGCSFVATHPPPARAVVTYCPSKVAPIIDAYMGVGGVLSGLLGLSLSGRGDDGLAAMSALTLVAGGIYAGAAAYGFHQVRACNERRVDEQQVVVEMPPMYVEPVEDHVTIELDDVREVEVEEEVETHTTTRTRIRVVE